MAKKARFDSYAWEEWDFFPEGLHESIDLDDYDELRQALGSWGKSRIKYSGV